MMGHILHDWDLQQKKMLIAKAYEALPAGGAFIVYESIIDDDRSKNAFGLLMSLNMLIETPGGFDYTGADCEGWMKDAGFRDARRTARRSRLDGRRHQVGLGSGPEPVDAPPRAARGGEWHERGTCSGRHPEGCLRLVL